MEDTQTCRGMHVLGSADHVWRSLKFGMPLDLPSNLSSHPAHLIQRSAVRALRLDQNWMKKESNIKRCIHIPHTDLVKHSQFVGQAYIVTLSEAVNRTTFLSLWHIEASASRVARIEVPSSNRFAALLEDEQLVVALTASDAAGNG